MMKKSVKILVLILCVVLGCCVFAACDGESSTPIPEGKVRVTFMDGTTELSHIDIDKGGKVAKPETDPSKTGFEFVRWYATPSLTIAFDFDGEIEDNTKVYAGFRSTAPDNHTWYIVGESVSSLFKEVGWTAQTDAAAIPAKNLMVKDANQGNLFTVTADFYVNDMFQILNTEGGWSDQYGYGYMNAEQYSSDSSDDIYLGGGLAADPAKSNFRIGRQGNYTIKLYVDAAGALTEVAYVRNGDAAELPVEYNYFIKGAKITDWQNMLVDYTKFQSDDNIVYTLKIGMIENDDFMFVATKIGDVENTVYNFNATALILADDEATAAAITVPEKSANYKIIGGTGTYEFTVTEPTGEGKPTLTAEKIAATVPEYDFYVKGSIGGDTSWEERHKMTANADGTYSITKNIAKDEQFQIVVTEKGKAPATGMENDAYNINTAYADSKNISNQIDYTSGTNFTATATDEFTITINPVNMLVSVVGINDEIVYVACLHGSYGGAAWADSAEKCSINTSAEALTGTITVTLAEGDTFGFKTVKEGSTAQIDWANGNAAEGYTYTGCEGLDGTKGNITVTAAGTYKFTITLDADGMFVSVKAEIAE